MNRIEVAWWLLLAYMALHIVLVPLPPPSSPEPHHFLEPPERSSFQYENPPTLLDWDPPMLTEIEHVSDYHDCQYYQPYPRLQHACRAMYNVPHCHLENLQLDLAKIHSVKLGGEPLETVMGQPESDEVVSYDRGAFAVSKPLKKTIPNVESQTHLYYVERVLETLRVAPTPCCSTDASPTRTLFTTRYEYVNLYHTLTDLVNAFWELPDPNEIVNVVFLDAHPHGSLDSIWKRLFRGNVTHVQRLSPQHKSKKLCFQNAILVPPGYASLVWSNNRYLSAPRCPAMMDAFSNWVLERYNLTSIPMQQGRITILDRVPYLSHARSDPKKTPARRLTNLNDVQARLSTMDGVTAVDVVQLEHLDFSEQLAIVRSSHIIFANHGAALSHLVFLHASAHVLEMEGDNDVFYELALWRPNVTHTVLPYLDPEETALPLEYIENWIVPEVKAIFHPEEAREKYSAFKPDWEIPMEDQEEEDRNWNEAPPDDENVTDYRQCQYYQPYPRPTHGCVLRFGAPFCHFQTLWIDLDKLHSVQLGAEPLDSVMGQPESDEVISYDQDAFVVPKPLETSIDLVAEESDLHYVKKVLETLKVEPSRQACTNSSFRNQDEQRHNVTLLITRYEYVNLYHTLTDLLNAFWELPDPNEDVDVVFLDAHPEGSFDSVWKRLFGGNVMHVQHLRQPVCLSNAILVPPGYSSPIWPDNRILEVPRCPAMVRAFSDWVIQRYSILDVAMEYGRISIVDRVPYVSHPRSDPNKTPSRVLTNLDELEQRLLQINGVTAVEVIQLEHLSFAEQLRVMRRSHVIFANHGAALSHLIFLQEAAHVMEINGASDVFIELARWRPDVTHTLLPYLSPHQTELPEKYIDSCILPEVEAVLNPNSTAFRRDSECDFYD